MAQRHSLYLKSKTWHGPAFLSFRHSMEPPWGMPMVRRFAAFALAFLLALPLPARAADDARDVVQTLCGRLLMVMKQADQLGFQGRAEKLTGVVTDSYDMPATTKATLGVAYAQALARRGPAVDRGPSPAFRFTAMPISSTAGTARLSKWAIRAPRPTAPSSFPAVSSPRPAKPPKSTI